ncbi:MAG: hypothetical protein IH605_06505 [Burkholderiales bacterium]|nr:hypothetical protein [Burkholderiales bacterium]
MEIHITKCDNALTLVAWPQSDDVQYEICTILSGNGKSVDVTIPITAGEYQSGISLNGVGAPLSGSYPVSLPAGGYTLAVTGVNWGGPWNFSFTLNGQKYESSNASGDGVVWLGGNGLKPPASAITFQVPQDHATAPPNITTPLVTSAGPPAHAVLGYLSGLIGTWNSPRGESATGFNVMPLPQRDAPGGYVLKNFPYYEEITFATIAGSAPNRGGNLTQNCNTLFYEQRVYFATNPTGDSKSNPVIDKLVHAENGAWLHLVYQAQQAGPYGPGTVPEPTPLPTQPQATEYVKQVSVPHGNSILAVGNATVSKGNPTFPVANRSVPPFTDPNVIDPNTYLQKQLDALKSKGVSVVECVAIHLTTDRGVSGNVADIRFEQRHATVDRYDTTWYIEKLSNGTTQLQYSQTMSMKLLIGANLVDFIHVDANTLVPA